MKNFIPAVMFMAVLTGCSPVRVVDEAPPLDGCGKLGVISAEGENAEAVNRKLERDVHELGGNVLFMLVTDEKTSPDQGGAGAGKITKYGIAFNCVPY
ncbi:MAG TPA: hypothetical protein VFX02_02960 [Gammaproteobacteria bacterium]|nr:hypothetical protein [Gammaproteobacteria bacterium]